VVDRRHVHADGGSPEVGSGNEKDPLMLKELHARAGSGKREDPPVVEVHRVHAVDGTMNDRILLNISTRAVPSPVYNLTSYTAWWKRMEREETKFYKKVRKEEENRIKKKEENTHRRHDSAIKVILKPIMRQSADMRKVGDSCHSLNSTSIQVKSDKVISWTTTPPHHLNL
jgi:hypothetical protein